MGLQVRHEAVVGKPKMHVAVMEETGLREVQFRWPVFGAVTTLDRTEWKEMVEFVNGELSRG